MISIFFPRLQEDTAFAIGFFRWWRWHSTPLRIWSHAFSTEGGVGPEAKAVSAYALRTYEHAHMQICTTFTWCILQAWATWIATFEILNLGVWTCWIAELIQASVIDETRHSVSDGWPAIGRNVLRVRISGQNLYFKFVNGIFRIILSLTFPPRFPRFSPHNSA